MPHLGRRMKTGCALGAVLLLATGCGQALAGTALPNGDDAATYVGGKFRTAMDKLEDTIIGARDVTSLLDKYFKVDDQWIHSQISSARAGSPESRVATNRSLKNPDESIGDFFPADGAVEYTHLGPVYKDLEPTSWVSMPKPAGGLVLPCTWLGLLTPCRMAQAVDEAVSKDPKAVRGAKSMAGGKTELTVNLPFSIFLENKVELLPDKVSSKITDNLKKASIPTIITLNPDGTLQSFVMDAKLDGDNHHIELHYDLKFTGKATPQDLPQIPAASDVTVLPDQAAVDDFNDRLGKFQDAH